MWKRTSIVVVNFRHLVKQSIIASIKKVVEISKSIFRFLICESNYLLKKMYFNLAKQLKLLLYRRQITSSKVEGFAAAFRRYFKMFEKLPERRRVNNWENDKKLFKAITS